MILHIEFRAGKLEGRLRQHRIRLGQAADRKDQLDELNRASLVMRAQRCRRRFSAEFDRAKDAFLP
jgi:hypothetical protein